MARTLSLGSKDPQYIQHSLFAGAMKSIAQGISRLPKGDIGKAGDLKQVGGEFLFEVKATQDAAETKKPGNPSLKAVQVTWCHRMRNTRDHAEIPVINDLLIPVDGHIEKPEQKESHGRPRIERRSTFDSIKRSLSVKRHSWIGRRRSYNRERSRSASRSPSRLEKAIEMPKVEDIASAPAPIETVVETREPSTPNFPNAADLDIEEQTPLVDNSDVIGKLNPDANDIQALPAIK
ncbi:putative thioredoxin-like protein [Phaeomoniella chlamydospora]|uniref:Putative thioredoxin-like protein n=1 Tax=Phaeomoniella chlamydospora TaxID=158046 RepID=A0A0G2EEW0_PHACM|nr:putative thioredoxin-like protein [Phaeomoniella chlamydospora]